MKIQTAFLCLLGFFISNCRSLAQQNTIINKYKIKESVETFRHPVKQIFESEDGNSTFIIQEKKSYVKDYGGERMLRNQLGILMPNSSSVDLKENERILLLQKEQTTILGRRFENGLIKTDLSTYSISKNGAIKIVNKLNLGRGKYPVSVYRIDNEQGLILVTDASEGGGERKLIIYDNTLNKLLEYEPSAKDYNYMRFFPFKDRCIFTYLPYDDENPIKIAVYDYEQKQIVTEIELPIKYDNISNVECSKELVFISYSTGDDYNLSAFDLSAKQLWNKAFSFPVNQIDITKNNLVFRGRDLIMHFLNPKDGKLEKMINLLYYYPFPIEYNNYGLVFPFYEIQISHTRDENHFIFSIPRHGYQGNRVNYVQTSLIFYNNKNNEITSYKIQGNTFSFQIKELKDNLISLVYGNKIYRYEIENH